MCWFTQPMSARFWLLPRLLFSSTFDAVGDPTPFPPFYRSNFLKVAFEFLFPPFGSASTSCVYLEPPHSRLGFIVLRAIPSSLKMLLRPSPSPLLSSLRRAFPPACGRLLSVSTSYVPAGYRFQPFDQFFPLGNIDLSQFCLSRLILLTVSRRSHAARFHFFAPVRFSVLQVPFFKFFPLFDVCSYQTLYRFFFLSVILLNDPFCFLALLLPHCSLFCSHPQLRSSTSLNVTTCY